MEYTGYTPDMIKKDKKKLGGRTVLFVILLLLGAFLLIGFSGANTNNIADAGLVSYTDMDTDMVYYFEGLYLVDAYAHDVDSLGNIIDTEDFLVCYADADGNVIYTALRTEDGSDMDELCENYINDDSLMVGDVTLSGCFSANYGYSESSTMYGYLEEAYDHYSADLSGELLNMMFSYEDAQTIEEYRENSGKGDMVLLIMPLALIVAAIAGLVSTSIKKKELDALLAKAAAGPAVDNGGVGAASFTAETAPVSTGAVAKPDDIGAGEAVLDDVTFIKSISHSMSGVWHQYDVLLASRGYGWDMMIDWAEYMNTSDLQGVSQVAVSDMMGGLEQELTDRYIAAGRKVASIEELQTERSSLSVAGLSATIGHPVKIVWINQTNTLRVFTTTGDEALVNKYVETVIRRTFGTPDAMKAAKPLPEGE